MELKSQVTSLEISKRLKELGVKQESYFVHIQETPKRASDEPIWKIKDRASWNLENMFDWLPAFTVAELGEMLPKNKHYPVTFYRRAKQKEWEEGWYVEFVYSHTMFEADTEVDAMGLMLIYLKENNII